MLVDIESGGNTVRGMPADRASLIVIGGVWIGGC